MVERFRDVQTSTIVITILSGLILAIGGWLISMSNDLHLTKLIFERELQAIKHSVALLEKDGKSRDQQLSHLQDEKTLEKMIELRGRMSQIEDRELSRLNEDMRSIKVELGKLWERMRQVENRAYRAPGRNDYDLPLRFDQPTNP